MLVKEEPLEDDTLNTEMLVKIKGDPEEPEMAEPSSAATGTSKRNQYTSGACVRRRIRLFSLVFCGIHLSYCLVWNKYLCDESVF